jgi:hypothetical protein
MKMNTARTTKKTGTRNTNTTASDPLLVQGIEPDTLITEAREHLDKLVAISCYLEGDDGSISDVASYREEFNTAACEVASALDLLRKVVAQMAETNAALSKVGAS